MLVSLTRGFSQYICLHPKTGGVFILGWQWQWRRGWGRWYYRRSNQGSIFLVVLGSHPTPRASSGPWLVSQNPKTRVQ